MNTPLLYKLILIKHWEASSHQQILALDTIDDAFIHFSTREQVIKTMETFFPDTPFILAKI